MRRRRLVSAGLILCAAAMFSAGTMHAEPASQYMKITDTNNINGSSVLPAGQYDYWARNTQDGDLSTAWVEGASGDGVGEYIDLHYPEGTVLTGMKICPGYCKNQDIFDKNSAPSSITITAAGGSGTVDLSSVAGSYSACAAGVEFQFGSPLKLPDGNVRVTIASVRQGWKYQDTCISELYFKGYDGNAADTDGSGSSASIQTPELEELWEYSSMAYWVYREHFDETLRDASVAVSELTAKENAFLRIGISIIIPRRSRVSPPAVSLIRQPSRT